MVWGSCPVLSPFLGCLSGPSELDWGSVELLRTYAVRFPFLNALFVLASVSARRLGYSMLCLSVALFPGVGLGCPLLSSQALWQRLGAPPLLLGLRASLYRPNQRETIAVGDCYILCGRSGVSWSAWAAHRQPCEPFLFAAGCSMKE